MVCPICLDIVVEPHQLTCCGQHLCKGCGQDLVKSTCPLCRDTSHQIVLDRYFERNILNRLQVRCEICEESYELGGVAKHLETCHSVKDHHTALMTKKMNDELLKMLQDKDRQLEEKDQQLKEKDSQMKQKDQQLKDKDQQLYAKDRRIEEKDKQLKEKDQQLSAKDRRIEEKDTQLQKKDFQMKEKDQQLKDKDRQLNAQDRRIEEKDQQLREKLRNSLMISNNEIYVEMNGFSEKKRKEICTFSPPYYLHGYKMCFEVDLQRNHDGVDKYLRIDHYIMKGPFDDILQWPFRGKVTV